MGHGASVEIHHSKRSFADVDDPEFQELLSSKDARNKLFDDITKHKLDGIQIKGKINLKKLVWWFTNPENALYHGFEVNVPTINEAFKFTLAQRNKEIKAEAERKGIPLNKSSSGKGLGSKSSSGKSSHSSGGNSRRASTTGSKGGSGKAKGNKKTMKLEQLLTRSMFHKFLPVLLLFARFWQIFEYIDGQVVDDHKIFKGEFLKIQDKLSSLKGVSILGEISEDMWEAEFHELDRDGNGYFSFDETCKYIMERIKNPFRYDSGTEDDEDVEEDDVGEVLAPAAAAVAVAAVGNEDTGFMSNGDNVDGGGNSEKTVQTVETNDCGVDENNEDRGLVEGGENALPATAENNTGSKRAPLLLEVISHKLKSAFSPAPTAATTTATATTGTATTGTANAAAEDSGVPESPLKPTGRSTTDADADVVASPPAAVLPAAKDIIMYV